MSGVAQAVAEAPMQTTDGAEIILIDTVNKLKRAVNEVKSWPLLAIDVETAHDKEPEFDDKGKVKKTRLDYNLLKLRSIQFGNEEVVYVIDCALLPNWQIPEFTNIHE